jgi:membrane protease YdiL (CAAX protease family)
MSHLPNNVPEDSQNSRDPEVQDARAPDRRIPNFGHAALFISFAGLMLCLFELLTYALGKFPVAVQGGATTVLHPKLQIATLAATYFVSLLAAWFVYPRLWQRTLLDGLSWNWPAARSQAVRLIALGAMLGTMMQFVTYFITPPKSPMPIDEFFATPLDAWLITLFGTFAAPVFEEICFRGFLVPAFAIAYDWLSLPRTEEARTRWQATINLSPDSLLFSAILTSVLFAWMHAPQVSHLWAALLGLFSISLVLTLVRVKTHSVAASAMVHAAYNGFVFLMALAATGGYRHLDRMTH